MVATVGEIKTSQTSSQTISVEHKEYGTANESKIASSGQLELCRLCLAEDHSMDKCKLVSRELAILQKTKVQSLYRNRRQTPAAGGRRDSRYGGRFHYSRRGDKPKRPHAGRSVMAALQQMYRERRSQSVMAFRRDANPKAQTMMA